MAIALSDGAASSFADRFPVIFNNGVINIYSGTQPTTPNAAATGTLLARVTPDGAAHVPGAADGIRFQRSGKYASKEVGQTWIMTPVANGTAGYFRLIADVLDTAGASLTVPRLDGPVSTLDAPTVGLILPTLTIALGTPRTVEQFLFFF